MAKRVLMILGTMVLILAGSVVLSIPEQWLVTATALTFAVVVSLALCLRDAEDFLEPPPRRMRHFRLHKRPPLEAIAGRRIVLAVPVNSKLTRACASSVSRKLAA